MTGIYTVVDRIYNLEKKMPKKVVLLTLGLV